MVKIKNRIRNRNVSPMRKTYLVLIITENQKSKHVFRIGTYFIKDSAPGGIPKNSFKCGDKLLLTFFI